MTDLEYNAVTLLNVQSEPIVQEQIYDETNADPLCIRTTVRVSTVAHVGTLLTSMGVDVGGDLASGLAYIQQRLLTPRRRFRMWINGSSLFDIYPAAAEPNSGFPSAPSIGKADINNGPRPSVTIDQITSNKSVKITFSITFDVPNCNANNDPNGIQSLRWWCSDDVNGDNFLTTRVYEGLVRLGSRKVTVHAYRNFVMPPISPHFTIERMSFRESQDGLTLAFTIVQQEWWTVPPAPATKWKGSFTASSPLPDSALWFADLTVELEAPRSVDMKTLHGLCKKVMDSKISLSNRLNNNGAFVHNYMIRESLSHNTVSHSAKIMYQSQAQGQIGLYNMVLGDLGFKAIPGVSASTAANPPPTASMKGILAAAIQAQCSHAEMKHGTTSSLVTAEPPPTDDSGPIVVDAGVLESHDSLYHFSLQATNPITSYKLSSHYKTSNGRISLPTGKSNPTTGATATVVQLHRGHATRTIRIEATRLDRWPQLPSSGNFIDENGIEHRLIDYRPTMHDPALSGDGRRTLHTADLEATYALSRVPTAVDNLSVGSLPYLTNLPVEKRYYPASEYVRPEALLTSKSTLVAP